MGCYVILIIMEKYLEMLHIPMMKNTSFLLLYLHSATVFVSHILFTCLRHGIRYQKSNSCLKQLKS